MMDSATLARTLAKILLNKILGPNFNNNKRVGINKILGPNFNNNKRVRIRILLFF